MRSKARRGVLLLLLLTGTASWSAPAAAVSHGLCLFTEGVGALSLPVPASALRHETHALLSAAFTARNVELAEPDPQRELLARWRVRSADDLPPGFLRELHGSGLCERLLVARLRILGDTLILSCRVVDTSDGRLAWVELVERILPDWREVGVEAWWRNMAEAAHELAERWPAEPSVSGNLGLILLPTVAVDVGPAQAGVLTECLLRRLLQDGRWWLPEPALVRAWLRERGEHAALIPPQTRRELGERLNGARLLRTQLVSYGSGLQGRAARYGSDGDRPDRGLTRPLFVTVHMVDSADGGIDHWADVFLPPQDSRGLFGRPKPVTWIDRFDRIAAELTSALTPSAPLPEAPR